MSKLIATRAIRGAHKIVERAEAAAEKALREKGKELPLVFPDTAYYLPFIYAMTGERVKTLGDALPILEYARKLLPEVPSENLWLPYLGPVLDAGMATLFAEEIIEVLKYATENPTPTNDFWIGFTGDTILRQQGIKLVDGRMPGFAAIVGCAPTNVEAKKIIMELKERSILVFMAGTSKRNDGKIMNIAEQLAEENIQMGWDVFLVPFGREITTAIYALNFAARAAITFGGLTPGDIKKAKDILLYNKERVYAFVIALGEVDDEKHANAAGAINFGFPAIADTDIGQILPTGVCKYEHVVSPVPRETIVTKAIEVRGLKIHIEKLPIPVPFGSAFEGERVRREQVGAEFGSTYSKAFEFLTMKEMEQVEDGKIEVIGPDLDQIPEGSASPLGIWVEVAGRKMQKEFETILERRFHSFLSEASGVMHISQRDQIWIRISKEARNAGLRLKHFGTILHALLHREFPSIVDKVQVKIYTKLEDVEKYMTQAKVVYNERDERMAGMKDEDVDTFYSCILCQSYAPTHVCIITPERLGLCGAYTWLDGKAASSINPTGGNQPVPKGQVKDPLRGEWEGVNQYLYNKSQQKLERFCAYSILEAPMTSCGCFEAIVSVIPECNGVMVVQRGYTGDTPVGMTFSTLAGTVGGGMQNPGFIGVGRMYLTSKKFISAEGGFHRIVWMPKSLKEELHERLQKRAEELGTPDFLDKIADETIAVTPDALLEFLQKVNHPALKMPPILESATV